MFSWLVDGMTASKWFWRGLRKGDWIWLLLAVMIASSSVTLVEMLGQSVKQSMLRQAANNLGADYVLRSTRPIDGKWLQAADNLKLEQSQSESLVTMALSGDEFQLVQLKAVDAKYPLRGGMTRQAGKPFDGNLTEQQANQQVWVEAALFPIMKLKADSQILLGERTFAIAGQFEPNGTSMGMSAFAHQMMIPLSQMASTELKGPGSRVTYELALAGSEKAIAEFAKLVEASKSPHLQAISAQAPSEDMAKSLDTAWLFLELAALAAVLVAGLSILIASRFYLQRWQSSIALMKAFGASHAQMTRLFAFQLSWLAIMASGVGVAIGAGVFQLLIPVLKDYFDPLVVPEPGLVFLHGFLMGFLVLWSFAWQAFRQAVQTPPMQLLKADAAPKMRSWLISLVLIVIVVMSITGYVLWVLLGLLVIGVVLYLAAIGLLKLIGGMQRNSKGWLKLSLVALAREPGLVKIQLISMGLVLFVLMLMTFVRQDLMQNWQMSLPSDTPDTFIINVQTDQRELVLSILKQHGMETDLVAMARGRLVAINNETVRAENQEEDRARRLLERESNIAEMTTLPPYNEVIAQAKLSHLPPVLKQLPRVSLEQGMADLFKIKLDDVLTFSFSGQERRYRVDSIRKVEWQSFRLNFFFIVEPTENPLPISYIGNFRLTDTDVSVNALTKQLAEQTPGVLLIDARRILDQIQTIMAQASWAVSGLYLFTLAASLIVLFTATLASQQTRVQSWLLLRTLGASQKDILKIGLMEFVLLGALAGLLAATFAQATSMLISHFVLKVTPQFSPDLWGLSLLSGMGILLVIGWLTQRRYLQLSPREMAQKWS